MDVGSVVVGFAVGWGVQALVDVAVYRGGPSYSKALKRAQDRIDVLQEDLASARGASPEPRVSPAASPAAPVGPDERDATIRDLEAEIARLRARPAPEPVVRATSPDEGDYPARIAELERNLRLMTLESAEADRRQGLLETRLMDVESELASYRLGISPNSLPISSPLTGAPYSGAPEREL